MAYPNPARQRRIRVPQGRFWSLTLYDNQTRSMLETPQRYPRAGSQTYPSPAADANADGSTTVYFGPKLPDGVKRGNWIQTMPNKGWFTILRLYSRLEPWFEKTWKPGVLDTPTPRLDRLAAEGLRLMNFNVENQCTPSRAALMTGRLPIRSGIGKAIAAGAPGGLHAWEITLAEMLGDVGYRTAMLGKWHLGGSKGRLPTDQGFNEWFGFEAPTDVGYYADDVVKLSGGTVKLHDSN